MNMETVKNLKPGDKVIWNHRALEWMIGGSMTDRNKIYRTPAEVVYAQPEGRFVSLRPLAPFAVGHNIVPCVLTAWPEQVQMADVSFS